MSEPRGLPGGIALPAVSFLVCAVAFVYLFSHPGLIDLGPNVSPAGLCVLAGVVTFAWLIVAIAKRPPPVGS